MNLGCGRIKKRTIQVSEYASDCPDWLRIPVMRWGFRVRREAVCTKDVRQRKPEQVDSGTSLPPHKGARGPAQEGAVPLGCGRERGALVARNCGAGRCLPGAQGALPWVVAALTNMTVTCLCLAGVSELKRIIREFLTQRLACRECPPRILVRDEPGLLLRPAATDGQRAPTPPLATEHTACDLMETSKCVIPSPAPQEPANSCRHLPFRTRRMRFLHGGA